MPFIPASPMNSLAPASPDISQQANSVPQEPLGTVPVPASPIPPPAQTQPSSTNIAGRAMGKILGGLSDFHGSHEDYTIDPTNGKIVSSPVNEKPGQVFRAILAQGLIGSQGIGPKEGQQTFAQGLMSGLSGGMSSMQQRKDELDKQRRAQAQEQFANKLKLDESSRQDKELNMQAQLNAVSIANHNQEMVARKLLMDNQAYEWAKVKSGDAAVPLIQNSQMRVEADKPWVQGYSTLSIDPIATGVTADELQKRLQNNPGAASKETSKVVGTRSYYDDKTHQVHVEDLYNVYPAMTKVPPAILEKLKTDGADSKGNSLHPMYMDLLANKDNVDTRKLIGVYNQANSWENIQSKSLDIQAKQAEIGKNRAEQWEAGMRSKMLQQQFSDQQEQRQAADLYNQYVDPTVGGIINMDVLDPTKAVDPKTGAVDSKSIQAQRVKNNVLLKGLQNKYGFDVKEFEEKYKGHKDQYGNYTTDDPQGNYLIAQISNLGRTIQKLQVGDYTKTSFPDPKVLATVTQFKAAKINDPQVVVDTLRKNNVPQDQWLAVFNGLGMSPPSDMGEQAKGSGPSGITIATAYIPAESVESILDGVGKVTGFVYGTSPGSASSTPSKDSYYKIPGWTIGQMAPVWKIAVPIVDSLRGSSPQTVQQTLQSIKASPEVTQTVWASLGMNPPSNPSNIQPPPGNTGGAGGTY